MSNRLPPNSTLSLQIQGASENNLKNLFLEIEHDTLTVVTGLSGSGKSSLAFSTVYAEGQRRYIETFSPYTRQFLDRLKKPNVIAIENVRPAIAIQQKTRILSSRSTVGSTTNINELLKILYANLSEPHSPKTGKKFVSYSPFALAELIERWQHSVPHGVTILIAAPIKIPEEKKRRRQELERLSLLGFSRYFAYEENSVQKIHDIKDSNTLSEPFYVVLSRFRTGECRAREMVEHITQAYELSRGKVSLIFPNEDVAAELRFPMTQGKIATLSENYSSPDPDEVLSFEIPKRRAALFDSNSNIGACSTCTGFGHVLRVDPEKVVPNAALSISEGAIHPWKVSSDKNLQRKLMAFCEEQAISLTAPWHTLDEKERGLLFNHKQRGYTGIVPWFQLLERKRHRMHVRVLLARYRSPFLCETCLGTRLKQESRCFLLEGLSFPEAQQLPICDLLQWVSKISLVESLSLELAEVRQRLLSRLDYLVQLGLPYLTLDRMSRTLSGGETQRVNLTTALGSELVSTHFVLDEPSVGLHPRDTARLNSAMRSLQKKGNSLLVVEHDIETIETADSVLELGPGSGSAGGEVVYHGPQSAWHGIAEREKLPQPRVCNVRTTLFLEFSGAKARNLKNIDVSFPIGLLTSITGVSGSGKSSFVTEELIPAWKKYRASGNSEAVRGFEHFQQVLLVDQSPLTKSPRANIATYTGVWDVLRQFLSEQPSAERLSLSISSFSFNVDGGRCPACKGAGYLKEDMQFLSDIYVQCEECLGKRFQEKVLEVTYLGKNVSEWLACTITDLRELFPTVTLIQSVTHYLVELGLGSLQLGHPLSELSGGEAQRLKLIPFLEKSGSAPSLLIFDEPTTGLHLHDVRRLIALFRELTTRGHTVLCIEHNQELILGSDYLLDFGPEGGEGGGFLLCQGEPLALMNDETLSHATLRYLRSYVESAQKRAGTSQKIPKRLAQTSPPPLTVRGAREHNLKGFDIEIPHNEIIAITGVSGSGKSTLAKDIIYAEGQRRYLDCLSPYARQFIKELSKPDVREVINIRPTICVYQHTFQPGKRSTLGTMSEVYNFLRLLFAKTGTQFCPDHPEHQVEALSSELIADKIRRAPESTVKLLAPILKGRKGHHRDIFRRALKSEIFEVRADGNFQSTAQLIESGLERNKQHNIDYVWATIVPSRVPKEMIIAAIEEIFALSGGTVIVHRDGKDFIFSRERACPICHRGVFRPDPEDLSFHSSRGRCLSCDGTGVKTGSLCRACNGSRLKPFALSVRLEERTIADLHNLTAPELRTLLNEIRFDNRLAAISAPVLQEITARLGIIERIGLGYIPLSRGCETLSSGELQRLRLGTALGTPLSGALYIFDEPSAGLHPDDIKKIAKEFSALKDQQNSVLLIEHDEHTIKASSHLIEIGPEGGARGGRIVYQGATAEYDFSFSNQSELSPSHFSKDAPELLRFSVCSRNNIQNLAGALPLGRFVVIAGVSGAGKSTLMHEALTPLIMEACENGVCSLKNGGVEIELPFEIDRVLVIDQAPIGKNSRSTPASYLKLFDEIRKLFATTIEARSRGWTPSFFSYNSGAGRCKSCKGLGIIPLEMSFLSEAHVTCDECRGLRYSDEALSVRYQGRTIAEVLRMTFEEAKEVFFPHKNVHRLLHTACELGLGYLQLGQSSSTLSGGESQRIKLIPELAKPPRGHTLYLLDEPTIGLHRKDVAKLLKVLHSLVALGNTVITIEHDSDIIRSAHHILELGPGAGEYGGKIIFDGPPTALQKSTTPWGEIFRMEDGARRKIKGSS